MRINAGCVIEGVGEEEAVPIILRRLVSEAYNGQHYISVPRPVRIHRHKLVRQQQNDVTVNERELGRAAELAARNISNDGFLLVLVDSDGDCSSLMASAIRTSLYASHSHLLQSVVIATREFEAWFLAAAASLSGRRGLPQGLRAPPQPESVQDPKAWLSSRMQRRYSPRLDQPALAAVFDLAQARTASSFDKLWRDTTAIIDQIVVA